MVLKLITDNPDSYHTKKAIMIDQDRYDGCYSGFSFTAWYNEIPVDISAGDYECENYWKNNNVIYGGGSTPDEAVADLFKKFYQKTTKSELEVNGKIEIGYYPQVEIIWNTSEYNARCPVDQRVIWIREDPRFKKLYPKAEAIFNQHRRGL